MIALLLALLGGCTADPPRADAAGGPDTVVMFVGCTVRADRLTPWGAERDTTPYLAALAREGVRVERVISNAPWSRPGIGALVTGRHPLELAIDDPGPENDFSLGLPPAFPTLAERFVAAGWTAVGGTANPNASSRYGFGRAFSAYLDPEVAWRRGIVKSPGSDVVDFVLDRAADVEGPLYVQLVVVEPHRPLAPLRWRRLVLGFRPWGEDLDAQYQAALTELDDLLERLDRGLEDLGRGDRLLSFVADHGEGIYDPPWAGRGHATHLYDANLHVPWVLHGPGLARGATVEGLFQSIDVAPTILDLAGLPGTDELPGRSLAAAARGEGRAASAEAVVSVTRFTATERYRLTTEDWTFIRVAARGHATSRGPRQLYRARDRRQARNLVSRFRNVARRLEEDLEARVAALEASAAEPWRAEGDTSEQEAQLRALGYVAP